MRLCEQISPGLLALSLAVAASLGCDRAVGSGAPSADRPAAALAADWWAPSGSWRSGPDGAVSLVEAGQGASLAFLPEPALDFTLSARLTLPADGAPVGLAFEGRDAGNHSVLAYDGRSRKLLVLRSIAGEPRSVVSADLALEPGSRHELSIHAESGRLRGLVDGEPRLEAEAGTSTRAGRVGLWGSPGATFDSVDVRLSRRVRPLDPEAIRPLFPDGVTRTANGDLLVDWPRSDLTASADAIPQPLAATLTSRAAFRATPEGAWLMARAVVLADEVDAVMDAALAHELTVTALHHHALDDEPRAYSLHLGGHGPLTLLAAGVQSAWRASEDRRRYPGVPEPEAAGDAAEGALLDADAARAIEAIVGQSCRLVDGGIEIFVGRETTLPWVVADGELGFGSRLFLSGSPAVVQLSGELALTQGELQPALRALRRARIGLTALRDSGLAGEPRYAFAALRAGGAATDLARRLRSVFDARREAAEAQNQPMLQ
jgi:hypothetical protein